MPGSLKAMTIMSSTRASVNPLARLATRDLVVLTFIVKLGLGGLRWSVPGVPDLDVLRGELRRREGAA